MFLPRLSIERPVFALMVTMGLIVFGLLGYQRLSVSLFPDVDFPVVTINATLPGADPETMESEVTKKIEEAVNTLSGLDQLRSETIEGFAQIFVTFDLGQDIDVKSQEVRDRLAAIQAELPAGMDAPIVEKFDPDASPILAIVVSGPGDIPEVTQFAEDLKEDLQRLPGVGNVRRVGGREREIRVWIDRAKLWQMNIGVEEVMRALARENVEIPGGRLEQAMREMSVKTLGKFQTLADFRNCVVAHRGDRQISLGEVALINDGLEDERSLSRLNRNAAVSLQVRRQSGQNLVAVAELVKKRVDQLRAREVDAQSGYSMLVTNDQSVYVGKSINGLKEDILIGGILTVLIILFFLRNWRLTLVAAVIIPVSLIATLWTLDLLGYTLNVVSMLALALAVGVVVDDAIVMIENIFRHLEMGKTPRQAALDGASQIGFAVVAMSFSLMAVFLPIAMMQGLIGRFFVQFGFTVAAAIFWSLLLALTLAPMLASLLMRVSRPRDRKSESVPVRVLRDVFALPGAVVLTALNFVDRVYERMLALALRNTFTKFGVLALTGLAFVVVVAMAFVVPATRIGTEFTTPQDASEFRVTVEAPVGSSVQRTSEIVQLIEARLATVPEVAVTFSTVGAAGEGRVNLGDVYVGLSRPHERVRDQFEIMADVREEIAPMRSQIPGIKLTVSIYEQVSGGGFRNQPIQFNLRGADLNVLNANASDLREFLDETPGIVDANTTFPDPRDEVQIIIDRDRAATVGLVVEDIASTLRVLVGGEEASKFQEGGEEFEVRVRLRELDRQQIEDLLAMPLRTPAGKLVELGTVVTAQIGKGPTQIDRQDQQRQITVLANLEGVALGDAVAALDTRVAQLRLPDGYEADYAGQAELMAESFQEMIIAFFIAIVLVYMILASQFNSIVQPLVIMATVPLAVIGALLGLIVGGKSLSIFAMIGIIMLIGLGTKNAILLIEFTNQLRAEGYSREDALKRAGPIRLRPILMTAVSTIGGMLPIALELSEGGELRAPLAWSVIGGLFVATFLTLFVIPVMYSLADGVAGTVKRIVVLIVYGGDDPNAQRAAADATAEPPPEARADPDTRNGAALT